jgi:hypothetical protein
VPNPATVDGKSFVCMELATARFNPATVDTSCDVEIYPDVPNPTTVLTKLGELIALIFRRPAPSPKKNPPWTELTVRRPWIFTGAVCLKRA